MENQPKTIRKFTTCPRCGSPLVQATSFSGTPSTFWLECSKCNTFVNTYMPLPHQEAIHKDVHKLIGNFGGYGTGKSLTDYQDLVKHILITPNADAMVAANISYQYEQTVKKELEKDIPGCFVDVYSVKNQRMVLLNGAVVQYRPLDDPNKLRSNNLSYWLVVEGSETIAESFHQLKTRLRNNAATLQAIDENGDLLWNIDANGRQIPVIAHDWRKGIVESNPDAGWVKTDMLLVSDKISQYGKANDQYDQDPATIDKMIASHIATTHVNTFLPNDYIAMISKNKPEWWVNRFVNSSFMYAEGLVYPNARRCIVPYFDVEQVGQAWKRICAFDYGLSDNAVFLFGAVDEQAGLLYIYKEIVMNNNNVEELANAFKEAAKGIPIGGWITQPIMDPKNNKRDYNKKDLATHFLDYGIAFKPGHVSVDARILRLNTYIETDHLRIMDNCTYLIGEITDYKFEERTLDNSKRQVKPVDKNNHAINPLEWICMELPSNPANLTLGVYNVQGLELGEVAEKNKGIPWQLRDDADPLDSEEFIGFEVPDYEF
jgi:hypothetical protein